MPFAIINRHRRWQFTSERQNVTLRVTTSGRWVVQLCNDFCPMIMLYRQKPMASGPNTMRFRDLLRHFLWSPSSTTRTATGWRRTRWLSEILLLLTSRFQQPARMLSRNFPQRTANASPG